MSPISISVSKCAPCFLLLSTGSKWSKKKTDAKDQTSAGTLPWRNIKDVKILSKKIALKAHKEALENTQEPFLRITLIHGNITGTTTTTAAEALNTSFFFSQYAEKYPFGNFLIALCTGLLFIGNGVPR